MENNTKLIIVIAFFGLAIFSNVLSSSYISHLYENDEEHLDIVLDSIDGNYTWAMKLAEIIILMSILIFITYSKKSKQEVIKIIFVIACFNLIRGILIPLTLLNPINSNSFFHSFTSFAYGLFPSGHISITFLFFLFTPKKSKLWFFYLIVTIVVGFLILLGKQHYTIDIISSIFIMYSIKCFTERNLLK